MHIETRDWWGRASIVDVPEPVATPKTLVVRTMYSWKWPSESAPGRSNAASPFRMLLRARFGIHGARSGTRSTGASRRMPDRLGWRLTTTSVRTPRSRRARAIGVSFIGAGEFAPFLLKYVLRDRDVALRGVVDLRPARARFIGDLYGFAFCSTVEAGSGHAHRGWDRRRQ